MVDAINGNYGSKSQDLSINWNDLTATEVLEYQDEGQEVPDEILAWAQEMAATDLADDVTYEMSESQETESSGNAATELREEMTGNKMNLKEQGEAFIEESRNKENLTLQSITEMAPLLSAAQQIGNEAVAIGDETKTQLDAIQAQIDALINEKNDKPRFLQSRSERGELQGLQAVAQALGAGAQNQIGGLDAEIAEIDAIVNEAAFTSQTSIDFGNETTEIGNTLMDTKKSLMSMGQGMLNGSSSYFIFGGKRVGREAVEQGARTTAIGEQGLEIAEQTAAANGIALDSVSQAAGGIDTTTNGSSAGDESNSSEDTNGTENTETENASNASRRERTAEEELDPTLADTSITTDPDEILRRKERRGLA